MNQLRPPIQYRYLLMVAGAIVVLSSPSQAGPPPLTAEQSEFFETRIRPVLIEHCYACHNSSEVAEGGLALDHRQGLLDGGDRGSLLNIGQPARSLLIAILRHEVEGLEMPQDGPQLSDSIIADFEKWITMGAPDPREMPPSESELSSATSWEATRQRRLGWWSFRPIEDPQVPAAEGRPIDRFIRQRLREHQLEPSPPAAPPILIRRLYLTLIGLPPTIGELTDWMQRYEQAEEQSEVTDALIDHLLSSDHFGERWARHWMDWIRYAESHGSEGDPAIDNAWLYRDYLIRAWNADVPFDQLVREHVAGDLLDAPRINQQLGINESVIGTAHWRMVFHGFAPTDALDEKVRFVDDQVNAFSKAFLGLTVSCARCHDHKFDAISQRDYYAMFGILASCRPGRVAIEVPERQRLNRQLLVDWKPKIRRALADAWLESLPILPERLLKQASEATAENPAPIDSPLHLVSLLLTKNQIEFIDKWQRLTKPPTDSGTLQRWDFSQPDAAEEWNLTGLGLEDQPGPSGAFAIAPAGDSALAGIYPAGIYSHLLSDKHAARLTSPDISLTTESEVWLRVIGDGESTARYVVQDYPRNGTVYPVTQLTPRWTWQRFDLSYWSGDDVYFEIVTSKDAPLLVRGPERSWFGVSEVRFVKKGSAAPPNVPSYPGALLEAASESDVPESPEELANLYQSAIGSAITAWSKGDASDSQAELLSACVRYGLLTNSLSELPSVAPMIARYRELEAEIATPTRVPSLEETSGRTQPLLVRGNHHAPGVIVPRRFLEAIDTSEYGYETSGRQQLADDLLREENPLTRRVIVNRLWHHLFGRGIVATPDNLGRMGLQPTHPDLLDWLACRLVDDGWSLKEMIRRIVSSQTWQQSSRPSAAAVQADPNNLYLSHANLRRLEAEAIRDSLLLASGSLDPSLFGPPVNGDANRRSIYVRVIRNSLDPFLRAFDFPEPFSATGRRDVTNVPAQSLTLMNDPLVNRWATTLAGSVASGESDAGELESDLAKVQHLFLTLLSRSPEEEEVAASLAYLQVTRDRFLRDGQQRDQLTRQIDETERVIASIHQAARRRIETTPAAPPDTRIPDTRLPDPIAKWDFEDNLVDAVGGHDGTMHGNARIENGVLVLESGSYVTTTPLTRMLKEKTLEAWVRLDELDQRGGGVISLQSLDGSVFDSIVFGEKEPGHWLAGSEHHRRTKMFGGPAEREAHDRAVHLAIAYHADGTIVGYRDGVRYGNAYRSDPPVHFRRDQAVVGFGLRHLPAGGNRLLRGRIEQAALYNRALSDSEVAASFQHAGGGITQEQLLASLSPEERNQLDAAIERRSGLQADLQSMGPQREPGELAVWAEMSRALLLLKELIYVR